MSQPAHSFGSTHRGAPPNAEPKRAHRRPGTRMLLSLAALGLAASIAGLGTYATFTSTTAATQTVSSGTVVIALGATGTANRLTVNATNIVPGDTMQRSADLSNTGNQNLASITLSTTATVSSLLDTDTTNGLQMVIDRCSVPWSEAGTSPAFTYTCSGTTTSVLATRAIIGTNLALNNLNSVTAGALDHLRVTLTFPSIAGNTFQSLSSTIVYTFTGTQRAATNQ